MYQNNRGAKIGTNVRVGSSHRPNGYVPGRNNNGNGAKYGGVPSSAGLNGKNEINGSQKGYQAVGMGPRNNSKIQPKNGIGSVPMSIPAQFSSESDSVMHFKAESSNTQLLDEVERLQKKLEKMSSIVNEKDAKIESQTREITTLRKKNFDFRAKILELEDKAKESKESKKEEGRIRGGLVDQREQPARVPRAQQSEEAKETMQQIQLAMQMQQQENRQRERDIMMQVMMNSMLGSNGAAAEEERLLQRAIEESKQENFDPERPNVDEMTYEQICELEEKNGKVSKGLRPEEISRIPEKMWMKDSDTSENSCSICFDNFSKYQKFKKTACGHEYHSGCINKWLKEQKKCPICSQEVI